MHLFLLGLFLFALPFLFLSSWGIYQLYLSGGALLWLLVSGVSVLLGSLCWSNVRRKAKTKIPQEISGEVFWAERDTDVWKEIQSKAQAIERGERRIIQVEDIEALAHELIDLVARHYYPNAKDPRLAVNLSQLLLVCEQASRDLRVLAIENIPFHDRFSVLDLIQARKTLSLSSTVYSCYRAVRALSNPASAVLAELRDHVSSRAGKRVVDTTSQWIVARFVESAGKHLINLYSGKSFDAGNMALSTSAQNAELISSIPLRVLVAGQADSGKSSWIDELIPPSSRETAEFAGGLYGYRGDHAVLGPMELLELPNLEYASFATSKTANAYRDYTAEADAVFLLLGADNAARARDLNFLEWLRNQNECSARILTLITRCDLLPPSGWTPPYDWSSPLANDEKKKQAKVVSVIDARAHIEHELLLDSQESVLLGSMRAFEHGEFLVKMQSLEAHFAKSKIARALKAYRRDKRWSNVKNSLAASGRLVAERGIDAAIQGAKSIINRSVETKREP